MRRSVLSLSAVLLAALAVGSARAQTAAPSNEVVSTASPTAAPPPSSTTSPTTQAQIDDWIKGAPPLGLSDSDTGGGVISAAPDKGVHGEGGAFVSNHGYGGYVAATMPVGENAQLGLAVQDSHYTNRYFRGDSRGVGASLALGQHAQRPAGCPRGVQVGDHYVEPLWATRFRDAPLADDPNGCFSPPPAR